MQEVFRNTEIAPVPGAPSYVLGIINLRDYVVTVIDTRNRFGLASRIVIIETEDHFIGIMVDNVAEVVEMRASEIETAPNVGIEETFKYIQGVTSRDNELLILADLNKFLSDDEKVELLDLF